MSLNILHLWRMKLHVEVRRNKILENDNLSKLCTNRKKFKRMKLRVILTKANTDTKIRFKKRRDIIKKKFIFKFN